MKLFRRHVRRTDWAEWATDVIEEQAAKKLVYDHLKEQSLPIPYDLRDEFERPTKPGFGVRP